MKNIEEATDEVYCKDDIIVSEKKRKLFPGPSEDVTFKNKSFHAIMQEKVRLQHPESTVSKLPEPLLKPNDKATEIIINV